MQAVVDALRTERVTFEVIAVSDGSTDGSPSSIAGIDQVRIVELAENQGKGAALRVGLAQGRGRYLGFIDGDGDIPARQLSHFLAAIRAGDPDVVLGSKLHPGSDVVYPPLRRLYSFGYQQLTRLLFRLPTRDTQTGIKLIRRETLAAVLPKMLEKRFAFDLELLVVARRMGYRNFVELPVQIAERFTTTISPKAVWRTLLDTLAIFYRLRIAHFYGPQLALISGHSQVFVPAPRFLTSRLESSLPERRCSSRPPGSSRVGIELAAGAPRALGYGQAAADPCLQLAGSRASPGRWRRGLPAVGGARVGEVRPRGDDLLCRRGRQARAGAC